ncbi:hypothetical protein Calab_3198 [Caldithrix abyssi DSM 13497]|uniref:Response regulator receiver domain-containing protein n=1 Tax=Caldithrix abyssi DSM 13497 TaxID=880073 RepID=H1XUH8_CALAY|nr:response regulator [Caldithrix abyssi]APF18829.1 Response regulator receiver domain-containing protein [Caldithrix abyssi DSM 13497]EHO42804.1 hypothetical protein Calab_3198 [Caldithrix abyssi DSM 13497]
MQNNGRLFRNNLLVIDPDHEFCKNVGMYLEDSFNVYIRDNVEYLDYTIILNRIDLVIVNVDNADENLLKELFNLKQQHQNVKIILMYTFIPDKPEIRRQLKKIADALITKPFDVELLKIKIECLLKGFRPQKQLDYF